MKPIRTEGNRRFYASKAAGLEYEIQTISGSRYFTIRHLATGRHLLALDAPFLGKIIDYIALADTVFGDFDFTVPVEEMNEDAAHSLVYAFRAKLERTKKYGGDWRFRS